MLSLAAWSWWGVLQGFAPGIIILISGVSDTDPYKGDEPGTFGEGFFFFGGFWLAAFIIPGLVVYWWIARQVSCPQWFSKICPENTSPSETKPLM